MSGLQAGMRGGEEVWQAGMRGGERGVVDACASPSSPTTTILYIDITSSGCIPIGIDSAIVYTLATIDPCSPVPNR